VPPAVGADIIEYIGRDTKLIFLESPGSNTFEIQDIPAVTALAKPREIITVLDNTWATPLYLKPFDLGVDISIQSVTKYISGHSEYHDKTAVRLNIGLEEAEDLMQDLAKGFDRLK